MLKAHDPTSKREQRLLILLPAAAVLVLYAFLVALPKQRQLTDLLNAQDRVASQAVDASIAEQSRENLVAAQKSLARLRNRLSTDRLGMKQTSQGWRNPDERLETFQQLTEMLDEYELSLLNQTYEPEPNISTYFRTLTDNINRESPSAPPIEFWKIEVEGNYSDMVAFLTALNVNQTNTIPLALEMKTSLETSSATRWTLIFAV